MRVFLLSTLLLLSTPALSAGTGEGLFAKLLKLVLPENYKVTWKDTRFSVDFTNLEVQAENLCLADKETKTNFCFEKLDLRLPILNAFLPKEGSRLHLLGGKGIFHSVASQEKASTSGGAVNILPVLKHLKKVKPLDLKVEVSEFQLISSKKDGDKKGDEKVETVRLKAFVRNIVSQKKSTLKIELRDIESAQLAGKDSFLQAELQMKEEKFQIQLKTALDMPTTQEKGAKGEENRIHLNVKTGETPYKTDRLVVDTELKGLLAGENISLELNNRFFSKHLEVRGGIALPNRGVSLSRCNIRVNMRDLVAIPKLSCRVKVTGQKSTSTLFVGGDLKCEKQRCSFDLKSQAVGTVNADIDIKKPFSQGNIRAHLKVGILSYQELVLLLKEFGMNPPAPLGVLQGPFSIELQARPEGKKKFKINLDVSSNLKSSHQAIRLKSESTVDFKDKNLGLISETVFSDVQFVLPNLELLQPMPAVTPDARIQKRIVKKKKGEKSLAISHLVRLRTEKESSFRIKTNLVEKPIPIFFDISHSSTSPTLQGVVRVKGVELELFRRKALLESMNIELQPDVGTSPIRGRVRVKQAGYTIIVKILGTVNEPFIRMESTPFLPPSDIVSVLLFGKTNAELAGSESDSVNSMQQAMSSRAFSLLSLFFLSSTPIESIIYDPVTNRVTASVRLGGNRLSVASQSGNFSQVGIERKVFRNITLRTYKNFEEDDNSTTTVLEWEKRY